MYVCIFYLLLRLCLTLSLSLALSRSFSRLDRRVSMHVCMYMYMTDSDVRHDLITDHCRVCMHVYIYYYDSVSLCLSLSRFLYRDVYACVCIYICMIDSNVRRDSFTDRNGVLRLELCCYM